jgi:hypothetical protein
MPAGGGGGAPLLTTTINYKGLSLRGTLTVNFTDTLATVASDIIALEGLNSDYYADFIIDRDNTISFTNNSTDTVANLGLETTDTLVAILDDNPSVYNKEQRQLQKLEISEVKRAADGKANSQYDVAQLPNPYNGNDVDPDDTPNTGGLLQGRPWSPDTIITVIEEGLVLNLDARNLNSWSREPGETTWNDLSGNNNHATVYGGIAYGEALGGALAFDGSNEQYAQCVPGVYFTSAGYTIQSWVYIISVPNWNRIIDFGSDAGSDNVLLSATAGLNGFPVLWVGPSGTNAESTVQLLPNTGWHHVCATWTPTGTVGKVFIDGVMTGTASIPAPTGGVRANCYIGRSNWGYPPGGPDPNFNGGMGAIQIYSRALSDAEITQNYNTTKSYYGL